MIRTLPVFLMLLGTAFPAEAQESPLAQIPANAPLVVSVRGVKRTTDRFQALLKNAMPDHAKGIQTFFEDFLKKSPFGNRQLQGLKEDGPIFLVLRSLPKLAQPEQPSLGLIARVTDYKAFRDGLLTADERQALKEDKTKGWETAFIGTVPVYFIQRPDYAVVCFHEKAAADFAKKEQGQGFAGTLSKPLGQRLLAADVALYVDMAAVNKEYEPIIKVGKAALGGLIDAGGEESKLDKGHGEMIKGLYNGLLQVADDATNLFVSCDFRPQGLALHISAGFAGDSKTNQVLKTMKPSPLAGLQALPAGFTTYSVVDFGPEGYKAFHPLVKNLLAASVARGDQASEKALADALDDLLDAKPRQLISATKMGAGRAGIQIWQYADAVKGAAAQLRMFKALKEGASFQLIPLKGKPVVKAEAQAYRDVKLHRVSLKWDMEKLADGLLGSEDSSTLFKKFSGEGATLWFGKVGKDNLQVSAKDWPTANGYLDKYSKKEDTIGAGDKAFGEARGNLPREANLVTLIHVPQYGQYFTELLYEAIRAQGGKGVKAPAPPEKKPPDSYLGMAVTLQAGEATFDLWVPGEAVGEFSRILAPILKQMGGK